MQVQKSFKEKSDRGTLYLVPTPIGNLQDMTFRSVTVLQSVDFICAEDTRNTGLLLNYFDIKTKQISFHEYNAHEKIPDLLELLLAGKSLAQVSDAGMPSISDPGHDLVKAALEKSIPVVALPGASAGITALIASGLAPQPHSFYGFLPRKKGAQLSFFQEKKNCSETQIYYESPYRVGNTLANMREVYGERSVTLVRELTKIYEEYQRGSISELMDYIADHPLKGECLLIVAGNDDVSKTDFDLQEFSSPLEAVQALIAEGNKPNQAIKQVAKNYQINRQSLYNLYHEID